MFALGKTIGTIANILLKVINIWDRMRRKETIKENAKRKKKLMEGLENNLVETSRDFWEDPRSDKNVKKKEEN